MEGCDVEFMVSGKFGWRRGTNLQWTVISDGPNYLIVWWPDPPLVFTPSGMYDFRQFELEAPTSVKHIVWLRSYHVSHMSTAQGGSLFQLLPILCFTFFILPRAYVFDCYPGLLLTIRVHKRPLQFQSRTQPPQTGGWQIRHDFGHRKS
jgi:hypothetical protein